MAVMTYFKHCGIKKDTLSGYFIVGKGGTWVTRNNLPSLTYQLLCRMDSRLIEEFKNDIRITLIA